MKTICIYHSRDLDGWMSAAIVKEWFLNECEKTKDYPMFFDVNSSIGERGNIGEQLHFLGWDYGDDIPYLTDYDKVIMCDISFPKEVMAEIYSTKPNSVYIDHHTSAIKELATIDQRINGDFWGLRDTKFAACELTWKYFFPEENMPELVRLLGRYDCFGHKGTDEEQKVLEFQYGARQAISNYHEAYNHLVDEANDYKVGETTVEAIHSNGVVIYNYLKKEAEQIYKKAFNINFYTPGLRHKYDKSTGLKGLKKFLCVNQERFNPVNFGIDYHKDEYDGFACYWYKDGKWSFSLYNDDGEVDCSAIAKEYSGGGHKGAAGFVTSHEGMLEIITGRGYIPIA